MALSPGARIGAYETISLVGAGGMGEVYRARDTRLKREVALKVLPDTFAADPERMARFQREAEVLASLNHPNIAHIYGLEAQALVMEFVDGHTLPCPLPIETALEYGRQIAEALEYAHDRGVIHRDLKPANIKLMARGAPPPRAEDRLLERRLSSADGDEWIVKLLDFGLAKALDSPTGLETDAANSPTLTLGATRLGVVLGTAAYMSPEQASGKSADRRADIWSFGAVLFEMLAGKKAFDGESASDTLASVLKLEPDWAALPAATPPAIRRLIERCLTKDRRQRLQAIGEARIALENPVSASTTAAAVPPRARSRFVWPAVAAFLAIAASAIAVVHFHERPPTIEPVRFEIPLPEGLTSPGFPPSAISPDGRQIAFLATGPDGKRRLYIRALSSLEAKPLAGSEVESLAIPFWSPDGRYLAYAADGKLKKIAIDGGPPTVLSDIAPGAAPGGAWNENGVILLGSSTRELVQVSASGGQPRPVVKQGVFPVFLPDGKHFVYLSFLLQAPGLYVGSLDAQPETQSAQRLLASVFAPVLGRTSNGETYLFFPREGTLLAQRLDINLLQLVGEPVPIADGVGAGGILGAFSASASGAVVYMRGTSDVLAQWRDRQGRVEADVGEGGIEIALSPDGTRAATMAMPTAGSQSSNLWLLDLARGRRTRLTFGTSRDTDAVWSPDGSHIVFASARGDHTDLFEKRVDGADAGRLVESNEVKSPTSWSSDGRFLFFTSANPKTKNDIWLLPFEGRKPVPWLRTEFSESHGFFSPDGRWVAYISNESGKNEAYVRRFVPPGQAASTADGKTLLSSNGAETVRWRRDGGELFYEAPDGTIMSVAIRSDAQSGDPLQPGSPQAMFPTASIVGGRYWDPTADGQRFLVGVLGGRAANTPFTVVLNWPAALKELREK